MLEHTWSSQRRSVVESPSKAKPGLGYRLMVVQYRVLGALGLGDPREHLARVPLQPGQTVVDWGCGPGRVTIPLAKLISDGKVVAVDVQPFALEVVAEMVMREGLGNVETVLLESYPVSIPAESADIVLLLDTFHAVTERQMLLTDISRVLKPGGKLFMDSGHMDLAKARGVVQDSALFPPEQSWGRDMLFAKPAETPRSG
jgi:SAM-dependent methyltransferase